MSRVKDPQKNKYIKHNELYNKELLVDLYINKSMPATEIAKMYNVSVSTIFRVFRFYNLQHDIKDKEDVLRAKGANVDLLKDKERLNHLYNVEFKSLTEIAEICKVPYNSSEIH